jgi:hypothetical protein
MKIWATVDFGATKITQPWDFLDGEIGEDSEPHDYLIVFAVGDRKRLVIELEKQCIATRESDRFYLECLNIANAVVMS